jgi:hypothetical protein
MVRGKYVIRVCSKKCRYNSANMADVCAPIARTASRQISNYTRRIGKTQSRYELGGEVVNT